MKQFKYIKAVLILSMYITIYGAAEQQKISKLASNYSVYPIITGEAFRNLCHHKLDAAPFLPYQVEEGDLIFVDKDNMGFFFSVMDQIEKPFIVISHLDSETDLKPYEQQLNAPHLIAWFTKNADKRHKKVYYLPLGVGRMNPLFSLDYFKEKFDVFRSTVQSKQHFYIGSKQFCYTIFQANSGKTDLLTAHFSKRASLDRKRMYDYFASRGFCKTFPFLPYGEYIDSIKKTCFILAPQEKGFDSYRIWEALSCGSAPIILNSPIAGQFKNLPVVIVNQWSDITEDFLREKKAKLAKRTFMFQKLFCDFWINKILRLRMKKIPNAKRPLFISPIDNIYLDFSLLPFQSVPSPIKSSIVSNWITRHSIDNVVTFEPSLAHFLATAIPSYGHVIVVSDFSSNERIQFLSNMLHLLVSQKVILLTTEQWKKYQHQYPFPQVSAKQIYQEYLESELALPDLVDFNFDDYDSLVYTEVGV